MTYLVGWFKSEALEAPFALVRCRCDRLSHDHIGTQGQVTGDNTCRAPRAAGRGGGDQGQTGGHGQDIYSSSVAYKEPLTSLPCVPPEATTKSEHQLITQAHISDQEGHGKGTRKSACHINISCRGFAHQKIERSE